MDLIQIVLLALGITAMLAIALGLVFGVSFLGIRGLAGGVIDEAQRRYPNPRLFVKNASFFGQESLGVTQGRGNGTLIITDSELVFIRWMPRKEFVISLKSITGLETPTSFLGKTRFTPLLKVVYTNDTDHPDSMAWHVDDREGVKRTLESAMR